MKRSIAIALPLIFAAGLTVGCTDETKTTLEDAGSKVEDAVDDAGDAADEMIDDAGDAMDDAADELKEATDG